MQILGPSKGEKKNNKQFLAGKILFFFLFLFMAFHTFLFIVCAPLYTLCFNPVLIRSSSYSKVTFHKYIFLTKLNQNNAGIEFYRATKQQQQALLQASICLQQEKKKIVPSCEFLINESKCDRKHGFSNLIIVINKIVKASRHNTSLHSVSYSMQE